MVGRSAPHRGGEPSPEAAAPRTRQNRGRRRLLFQAVILGFAAVLAEAIASTLYVCGVLWPSTDVFLFEESARTVQFDPCRGYRLTAEPARFARVSFGEVCYRGVLRGNEQGFADRDAFGPQRPAGGARRLLVLGDSFTSGQFLEYSWPDRVEDDARTAGDALQLLNMAVDGGGLMNWLTIVERVVLADRYEVDGVVLAVFDHDLERGFHVRDDSEGTRDAAGQRVHRLGYVYSWDPDALPRTLAEAAPHFVDARAFVVDAAQFEDGLAGRWRPSESRPFRPFLLWRVLTRLGVAWDARAGDSQRREARLAHVADTEGQHRAWERLGQALRRLGVPARVVRIPSLPELLGDDAATDRVRTFAARIGADYVDGTDAFAGLTADDVRAHWLRHDHHWNQRGSDRFAHWFRDRRIGH